MTTQAAGTTSQALRYEALDATAPATQLYYRLEQEDQDGTRHYSSVDIVAPASGPAAAASLTVAPNPAGAGQPLVLTVSGRAGQPLTLPATLPTGTYLLRLTGPGAAPCIPVWY